MEKQVVTSGGRQHGSKSPVLFRLQSWCTKMHFTCHMCIMCIHVWDTSIWILHVLSDIDDIRIFDDEKLLSLEDWRLPIQSSGFLCALP